MATVPTINANFGAVLDVGDTARRVRFNYENTEGNGDRGSIINEGNEIVYIGWNKEVLNADSSEEVDKNFLKVNDAIRIPRHAAFGSVVCAAGKASKIQYVED